MNFIAIIVYGYIFTALLLVYFLIRDLHQKNLFFNKHQKTAYFLISVLIFGIFCALYAHLVEPFILITKQVEIKNFPLQNNLKIAFVSDIQVGNHKKSAWVKKIVKKIMVQNPDLVIFGGDLIDNEGNADDETKYLEPLRQIAQAYPSFYILGNHEYGLGQANRSKDRFGSGDRSQELIKKMAELKITLLRNDLKCLEIKEQNVCLFGIDDIYAGKRAYSQLKNRPTNIPLIFITHNPDGILSYPTMFQKPNLILAGHSHGGQIYLPFIGPLGKADIILPKKFYRGLNYWQEIPFYTSIGTGESGGQIRFFSIPEIIILKLES